MYRKTHRTLRLSSACAFLPLIVTGCASTSSNNSSAPVATLKGSPVAITQTDYTPALKCIAEVANKQSYPAPRIAVGHVTDLTGADDLYLGRRLTQGATLMAITAASMAGMRVIERFDTGVTQVDLDFANNRLLRDSPTVIRTPQEGQIQGVDLYIVGGISEYNHNLVSRGQDVSVSKSGRKGGSAYGSNGDYVVDVGMDLRLIDARTTEVLAVKSYRKQVRGVQRELGAVLTNGSNTLDFGVGGRKNEPIQLAIRNIVDRSVFEFVAGLYGDEAAPCFTKARQISIVPQKSTGQVPASANPLPRQSSQLSSAVPAPLTPAPWLQQPRIVEQVPEQAGSTQLRPQSPVSADGPTNFGQTQSTSPLRGLRSGQLDQPFQPGERSNNQTVQQKLRREGN